MAVIDPTRSNVLQEEVAYKSSINEATYTKIGGAINFINEKQYDSHSFILNNAYSQFVGSDGADGVFFCLYPTQIVGLSLFQRLNGASGTTIMDVQELANPNDNQGTIFSTKPSINFNAPDFSYMIYDAISLATVNTVAGITSPVFSKTNFAAGTALMFVLDQAMGGASDLCLTIHHRPINASEV